MSDETITVSNQQWVKLQENLITFGSSMRRIIETCGDVETVRDALNALIKTDMATTFLSEELGDGSE